MRHPWVVSLLFKLINQFPSFEGLFPSIISVTTPLQIHSFSTNKLSKSCIHFPSHQKPIFEATLKVWSALKDKAVIWHICVPCESSPVYSKLQLLFPQPFYLLLKNWESLPSFRNSNSKFIKQACVATGLVHLWLSFPHLYERKKLKQLSETTLKAVENHVWLEKECHGLDLWSDAYSCISTTCWQEAHHSEGHKGSITIFPPDGMKNLLNILLSTWRTEQSKFWKICKWFPQQHIRH